MTTTRDEDWLKAARWDLPTDTDMFLRVIAFGRSEDQTKRALEQFMDLPAAEAMPVLLRADLVKRGLLEDENGDPNAQTR